MDQKKPADPSLCNQIRPPTYGNLITILSIDGGGIRGIIPGVIIAYLEAQLQVPSYSQTNFNFHLTSSQTFFFFLFS